MNYFKPKLFLGMTATPDKRDDSEEGKNVYEFFHYQIAHEIRLQQAMQNQLLCPFHYFGISDIYGLDDKQLSARKLEEKDFNKLTGDERVKHIIEQANYYGYSGDWVKGLVFCSRIDESIELSNKFNQMGFRTIALNGSATEQEKLTLEYLSKTVLSGVRPDELEILKGLLTSDTIDIDAFSKAYKEKYGYAIAASQIDEAVQVLQGHFVSKDEEYQKFRNIDILAYDKGRAIKRLASYADRLSHAEFYKQIDDIVSVGIARYSDKYEKGKAEERG